MGFFKKGLQCPRCGIEVPYEVVWNSKPAPYAAVFSLAEYPESAGQCPYCELSYLLVGLNYKDEHSNQVYRLVDPKWEVVESRHADKVEKWEEQADEQREIIDDDTASDAKKARAERRLQQIEARIKVAEDAFEAKQEARGDRELKIADRAWDRAEKIKRSSRTASGSGCALVFALLLFAVVGFAAFAFPVPSESAAASDSAGIS